MARVEKAGVASRQTKNRVLDKQEQNVGAFTVEPDHRHCHKCPGEGVESLGDGAVLLASEGHCLGIEQHEQDRT